MAGLARAPLTYLPEARLQSLGTAVYLESVTRGLQM